MEKLSTCTSVTVTKYVKTLRVELCTGEPSLGNFAWDLSFRNARWGSFTWECSLGVFGERTFVWDVPPLPAPDEMTS